MIIEKKLYTEKAKLFRELSALVWEGKELTFYSGIGMVNKKDNEFFLDALDHIQQNGYIHDIDEMKFIRKNKLADKMTIAEIKQEIAKYEKVVSVYREMHETTRKALAISVMMNHYNNFINQYQQRVELKKEYYLMESIERLKKEIKRLEMELVQAV